MTTLHRVFLAVALGSLLCNPVVGRETETKPDDICQLLFEAYIARPGKTGDSTVMAASRIIAERGRDTGFWGNVLRELRKGDSRNEIECVRILGKMLAMDASARDVIRRQKEAGDLVQQAAYVRLGPEVVSELVGRGKNADRFRMDHYAVALARARVPEAAPLFLMILRDDTGRHFTPSAKYHAAVGLANLGDPKGFEWLIANSDDSLPTVSNAWPPGVTNRNVNTCCTAALRELSGDQTRSTKLEWETWWGSVDRQTLPKRQVALVDP